MLQRCSFVYQNAFVADKNSIKNPTDKHFVRKIGILQKNVASQTILVVPESLFGASCPLSSLLSCPFKVHFFTPIGYGLFESLS